MGHDFALALVGLGTALIVTSVAGAVLAGEALTRVHFLTPITSLGAPVAGAGVCVAEGWGITSGDIILILFVLFISGSVLSAATGRLIAQQDGLLSEQGPE